MGRWQLSSRVDLCLSVMLSERENIVFKLISIYYRTMKLDPSQGKYLFQIENKGIDAYHVAPANNI